MKQYTGPKQGPTVTILGAVHGNETVGVEVIQKITEIIEAQGIKAGTLNLGIGNPKAYEARTRYIDKDLNRCFGEDFNPDIYEDTQAETLKPYLAETDLLLDIHATIKPSEPFMAIPETKHQLAHVIPLLGVQTVITGKGLLPPSGEPIYTDSYVVAHGGLGITIEAGWLEDPSTTEIIHGVMKALAAVGIFNDTGGKGPEEPSNPDHWDAYWNVIAKEGFKFTEEWQNFQKIPAGTIFAHNDGKPLKVQEPSIIIFPKPEDKIVQGQECCIIAKKLS